MEVHIKKGQSDDLKLLISFLKSRNNVDIRVVEAEGEDLPTLKIGGDSVSGTKTISLYLSSLDTKLGGVTNIEKSEVDQWLSFCNTVVKPAMYTKNLKSQRDFAKFMNEILQQRMYFASNFLTTADLIMYANLYTYMENLPKKQRFEACNISRWFDLMQHTPNVNLGLPLIDIDLNEQKEQPAAKPKEEKKGKPEGSKDKAESKENKKPEAAPAAAAEQPKENAKEGKDAKAKAKAQPAAKENEEESADGPDVSRLSLLVGYITSDVKKHADADSLYVEQIDVGEAKPRNVVSGLVKSFSLEEMKNRYVVVVANMKPASMRGVTSEAMVLCASNAEGKVEFVEPPAGSKPGDKVFVEGYENGTPDAVLNPKKKVFETVQPHFKTNDKLIATYKGQPFKTSKGFCTVKSIIGGSIK